MVWRNVGDNVGDMSETRLSDRQIDIINLLTSSPTLSAKKMSETLSVSQRSVERDLEQLRKREILRHIGKDNAGYWEILKH